MMNLQVCFIKKAVATPAKVLEEWRNGTDMLLLHLNSPFNEWNARAWSKWKGGAGTIFHMEKLLRISHRINFCLSLCPRLCIQLAHPVMVLPPTYCEVVSCHGKMCVATFLLSPWTFSTSALVFLQHAFVCEIWIVKHASFRNHKVVMHFCD